MTNLHFEQEMISSIDDFKKMLWEGNRHRQIPQIELRYSLISKVAKLYGVNIDKVVFYKNPYLFTMKDTCDNKVVSAKVEGNKCVFQIFDKESKSEDKCIINFTTKRFLKI